ncbi:MAG: flavin reductase family protein [Bacteroidota bacterium]
MSVSAPTDQAAERPEAVAATGDALRTMLQGVASPVVVVTVAERGATIGSFASVALDPPLVSFNVTHGTRFHEAVTSASVWAVHLLDASQADVADRFARPDLDGPTQLAPFAHVRAASGPALLRGTLGILMCRPHARFEAGDHTVFVGEVEDLIDGAGTEPLLYYRRSYRGIGPEVGPDDGR